MSKFQKSDLFMLNQNQKISEIKLKVHNEDDLYNPLDPEKEVLNDDVTSYFKRKYSENFDPLEKIVLRIISDVPVNENRVRNNIKTYIDSELNELSKKKRHLRIKQIRLFVLGIIFIGLWLIFSAKSEDIFATVLCIVGWFAVWEAANIWFVEYPEMRMGKHWLQKMQKTEIQFTVLKEIDGNDKNTLE